MFLTFLGTSSATPTRLRNMTSQALTTSDGRVWLFDCGEATQHQIMRSDIKPSRIDKIFITHFHGDHWYGLPGLLSSMKLLGRSEPIEIYSPSGLEKVVRDIFALSESQYPFDFIFHEISDNHTGWTMDNGIKVVASPMRHSIPSFAYVILEPDHLGTFLVEEVRKLGITDHQIIHSLASGESVEWQGQTLKPELFRGPLRPGLRVAILGDTCDASSLGGVSEYYDWMTHETTYEEALREKAKQYMHATTVMAAETAVNVKAKNLIMTHFSSRYQSESSVTVNHLLEECQKAAGECQVHIAEDFLRFDLRRSETSSALNQTVSP